MDLLKLFKKKSRLYAIELDDEKINKEIFKLVLKTEKHLNELSEVIRLNKVVAKDAVLSEIENNFLNLKSKVDSLRTDLQRILAIEIQNKDYVTIHDDGYLEDKFRRLDFMSESLEELIDLIMARPNMEELKTNLLNEIYARVNQIIDSLNSVINDDKHLVESYSKIESI